MELGIRFPSDEIRDSCRRHGIRKLEFFGCVLTDEFRDDSDEDVMVELESTKSPRWKGIVHTGDLTCRK